MELEHGQIIETQTCGELLRIIRMFRKTYSFTVRFRKDGGWWQAVVSSEVRSKLPRAVA